MPSQPLLTLALNNLTHLQAVDEKEISTVWQVFTKCKDNLENGRRLENMSWRLWYRSAHLHLTSSPPSISSSNVPIFSCGEAGKTDLSAALNQTLADSSSTLRPPTFITCTHPTTTHPKQQSSLVSPSSFSRILSASSSLLEPPTSCSPPPLEPPFEREKVVQFYISTPSDSSSTPNSDASSSASSSSTSSPTLEHHHRHHHRHPLHQASNTIALLPQPPLQELQPSSVSAISQPKVVASFPSASSSNMSRAVAAGMTTQDATATAHAIFQSVHKQLSSSVVSTGSSRATTGQSILGNACVAAAGSALTSSKSLPIVSKMPASMTANNSTSSSSGSLLPATMRSFVCTAAPRVIGVCQETDDYSDLESEEDGYSASALSSSDVCSETDYTDEDDDDSLMSSSSFSSTSSSTHLRQQLIHQEVDSVTASANQLATLLNGDDGKDDVEEEDLYNNISASFNEAVEPPSQQTSGEQASSPTSSSSGYCRKIINPLFEKIPTLPSFVSQTSSLSAAAAAASRPGSFIHPQHRQHTLLASSCKIIKKHQSALSSALRSVVAGNTNHSTAAFSFDEDCVDDCNRYNHTCSNHGSSSPSLLRPNPIFAKPNTGFPVGPPSTTSSIAASTVVPHLIHFVDRELSESLRRNLGVERRRLPLGMCLNGSEQK